MNKAYVRPWSNAWFMSRPGYRRFMVRELTAVPIAAYTVMLVLLVSSLAEGKAAYAECVEGLRSPAGTLFTVFALVGALYHSITFFNLVPKGMPLRIGEEKVPGPLLSIGMGYGPWLTVTVLVLWYVMGR